MRRPHQQIFCESGIGNHDKNILYYREATEKEDSVIIDNYPKIFYGSSPTDGEQYEPAYAFSTEAKEFESLGKSDNLKLIPETKSQVQDISRNKNFKLNIIPNFKNDDLANITNDSTYDNSNFSDDIRNVDSNNSILKLTKQVRKNIKSAKEDFDNFLRRTDSKNKTENFDELSEKDDIINLEFEDSSEKKLVSSQKFSTNVTSIKSEIDDDMSVRTPSSTKDVTVPGDVEIIPTCDHVHDTGSENTSLKTLKEQDKDSIFGDNKEDKELYNDSEITRNEEEYKKILLSILSSLNKLDITDNNGPNMSEDPIVIVNDTPARRELDKLSGIEVSLSNDLESSTDFPDEPPSSDSITSSSFSSSSSSSSSCRGSGRDTIANKINPYF